MMPNRGLQHRSLPPHLSFPTQRPACSRPNRPNDSRNGFLNRRELDHSSQVPAEGRNVRETVSFVSMWTRGEKRRTHRGQSGGWRTAGRQAGLKLPGETSCRLISQSPISRHFLMEPRATGT